MNEEVTSVPGYSLGTAVVNDVEYTVTRLGSIVHSIWRKGDRFRGCLWSWERPLTAEVIEIAGAARYP